MAKENFVLVSLDDKKAKTVANVVGSETARKILDALAEKDQTESELAKGLGMALSTVHYNLQQLVDAGLVVVEEFHYSKKGREVNHYKLANKYIIIAPKNTEGLASKLKGILPLVALAGGAALVLNFFQSVQFASVQEKAVAPTSRIAEADAAEALPLAAQVAEESADQAANVATYGGDLIVVEANAALWFLVGALFIISVLVVWRVARHKFK